MSSPFARQVRAMGPLILYLQFMTRNLEQAFGKPLFYGLCTLLVIGDFLLWQWQHAVLLCLVFTFVWLGGAAYLAPLLQTRKALRMSDKHSSPEIDDHA